MNLHLGSEKDLNVGWAADDGELDWKVIAISVDDPKASSVNDVEDVERYALLQFSWSLTWCVLVTAEACPCLFDSKSASRAPPGLLALTHVWAAFNRDHSPLSVFG